MHASEAGFQVHPSAKLCPRTASEFVPENYLYLHHCYYSNYDVVHCWAMFCWAVNMRRSIITFK